LTCVGVTGITGFPASREDKGDDEDADAISSHLQMAYRYSTITW